MDRIDIALIALGAAGCGLLHLTPFVLMRGEGLQTELQQTKEYSTGYLEEGKQ